jgi:hypothetical protein
VGLVELLHLAVLVAADGVAGVAVVGVAVVGVGVVGVAVVVAVLVEVAVLPVLADLVDPVAPIVSVSHHHLIVDHARL